MAKTPRVSTALGDELGRLRRARGLSIRGLAKRASIDATGLSRLESGRASEPSARTLIRLAAALSIDVVDLYAAAGYEPGYELPAFRPYLRAKYDLPTEAVDQLAAHFQLLNDKHRQGGASDGRRRK